MDEKSNWKVPIKQKKTIVKLTINVNELICNTVECFDSMADLLRPRRNKSRKSLYNNLRLYHQ